MTRSDLKMFDLLRENVFLKLPIHLYMVFLINCKTAKNPMDVDNITGVAERVHHELIIPANFLIVVSLYPKKCSNIESCQLKCQKRRRL